MKYLIIILLVVASCGNPVHRVGEEETNSPQLSKTETKTKVVEKLRVDTVYIDKTGNKTPYEVKNGKIVPQENVHYKVLSPLTDHLQTVVKIVAVMKNKHNVAKVWYTHNVFKNTSKFLDNGNEATIVTTVQTHNVGSTTFHRHFVEVRKASGYDVDKVSKEVKELGKQKFEELLTIIIN